MSRGKRRKRRVPFESSLACGCKTWFTDLDGLMHTKACETPGHEAMVTEAAYQIALERGMTVFHITDPPEPKPS